MVIRKIGGLKFPLILSPHQIKGCQFSLCPEAQTLVAIDDQKYLKSKQGQPRLHEHIFSRCRCSFALINKANE
jgi:hypothetical protein